MSMDSYANCYIIVTNDCLFVIYFQKWQNYNWSKVAIGQLSIFVESLIEQFNNLNDINASLEIQEIT